MTATAAPTSPACPRCGSALPGDAPAGLCPRCLLSDGFGGRSEGDASFRTGKPGPRFIPPTIDELAGEFPNLQFLQLLGSGGMGAVYLANQIRLDRRVAVKILPPDLADDAAFAERFLREARALARLSHPNIVGVYDFGQTPGGLYYFLMEYIEGPTLRQVVANRSTGPKQALEIVRQVCDALQFAHDKGVVHRDIKPENILLDAQGRVKIADFGLAKLLGLAEPQPGSPAAGSLTATRQAMGTPHYMAPEQIAGSRGVDHRADIYSLGVVFYELLTGDLPIGRFAAPSKKVQIDVRLDEVVLKSLEAEPAQRYQRASDVRSDVERISAVLPQQNVGLPSEGRAAFSVPWRHGSARVSNGAAYRAGIFAVWSIGCLLLVLLATVAGGDSGFVAFLVVGWTGVPAAIIATALGVSAITEIRRSDGRAGGLAAAVAAAVALPLGSIWLMLWALCLIPGFLVAENILGTPQDDVAVTVGSLIAVPVCLLAGFVFIRWAWAKASAGLPVDVLERELSIIPAPLRSTMASVAGTLDSFFDRPTSTTYEPSPTPSDAGTQSTPEPVATALQPGVSTDRPARTSLKAVVAAVWAAVATALGLLIAASMLIITDVHRGPGSPEPVAFVLLPVVLLFVAVVLPAPFAVTILGWSAVSDIRHSKGRLKGLPLAVFDGLFFPLLLLNALVVALLTGATGLVAWWLNYNQIYPPLVIGTLLAGTAVQVVACIAIDTFIVRAVWRRVKPSAGNAASTDSINEPAVPSRRRRDLIAAAIAISIALLLIGIRAWQEGFLRTQTATVVPSTSGSTYSTSPPQPSAEEIADTDRRWRMGPNGPELSPQWVVNALAIYDAYPLDPNLAYTAQPIDAALQKTYAEYEQVLDEHTTVTFEGEAVVFKIEPFPAELDRLSNEFWSRVDPLLDVEQQKIMRYNFPLRQEPRNAFSDNRDDLLMPIGHETSPVSIRIERSGLWYSVSANLVSQGWTTSVPELPLNLRRFQYRFEQLTSLRRNGFAIDLQRLPLVAPKPVGAEPVSPPSIPGLEGGGMGDGSMMEGLPGEMMPGGMMPGGMMSGGMMSGMSSMGGMPGADMAMPGMGMTLPDEENFGPDADLAAWLLQRGIDPSTAGKVAEVAGSIDTEYRDALDAHTTHLVEDGVVLFGVQPFPEKVGALERKFWEQVDPLLTRDQQRGLRQSLPVGELPMSGEAIEGRETAGLLPLGRHGSMKLRVERVGLWYRWDLDLMTDANVSFDLKPQESPSLPPWLSRFQQRYDELIPRAR